MSDKLDFTELAGRLIGKSRESDADLLQTNQLMEMVDALASTMPPEIIANARAHVCEYLLNNHAVNDQAVYRELTKPDPYGVGIMDMLTRMQSGRFKVFRHLLDWFEEFRLYHRRDGRVHKEADDLMSATRYAIMCLRSARTKADRVSFDREINYPQMGFY